MSEDVLSTSLRLFLSADLAGSTAFKQNNPAHEWQRFFKQFYTQLPAYLERQKETISDVPLQFWKPVGDEIVFKAELSSLEQVKASVAAFREAVFSYRKSILRSPGDLDIKCAGWTAGFPVGNLEVELPVGPTDYIGPSMDIGFRLVKEASPRRMLISVELAYLLSVSGCENIRLATGLNLKGVGKGQTYPCFWLDNFADDKHYGGTEELELEEEYLRGESPKPGTPMNPRDFTKRWLEKMGEPYVIPFIQGDETIGYMPASYQEIYQKVSAQSQGPEALTEKINKGSKGIDSASDILQALR